MSIMIIFSILLSFLLILFSYLLTHNNNFSISSGIGNKEEERKSQYECGIEVFEEEIGIETRERFYCAGGFYIISILFLIFDIETILLFPIILLFEPLSYSSLWINPFFVFLIFLIILILGLFYEFRKKII